MAYKNSIYQLKTQWFTALNGVITVPVYKDSVPLNESRNYVLIYSDGSADAGVTNTGFFKSVVIVIDIVTKFANMANSKFANDIANEIDDIIMISPNSYGITLPNFNITQITIQSENEINDDDGDEKVFRLIKRYEHFINQN